MITLKSTVKDLLAHPVGADIADRLLLQLGKSRSWLENPLVGSRKIGTLKTLLGKRAGDDFFDTILTLLNAEPDTPDSSPCEVTPAWWKEAVFYQIYPRSFMDSDGDGVGDLRGILSKLDTLKDLGVDALWLSPIYDSPNDDNGYDIRDYRAILPEFGTMEDFDALVSALHERGMRLIMDLVFNHTSDEHPWFQAALRDESSPYRDYYFFRKGKNGTPPNNWTSFFSGSAWNYYPEGDIYALHLFSKKQMDLNWDNPAVRAELADIARFWRDKGVDGFRMDVINYISKAPGLPDGNPFIGDLMGFTGVEHYFYGPNLHAYLRELNQAFQGAFSVGETPGIGIQMGKLLTDEGRDELNLAFSFDHLETPGHTRFDDYVYDLAHLKHFLLERLAADTGRSWNALFYDNHDNPRMLSKIDPTGTHRATLSKLLAAIKLTWRGTPFLYQGEELGAVNQKFASMEDLRDVESLNLYAELAPQIGHDSAFAKVLAGTRDHARVPMAWDGTAHGGFTTGTPWICGDGDAQTHNVAAQMADTDSVWHFTRALIALRKSSPDALVYGQTKLSPRKNDHLLHYLRAGGGNRYEILCNLRPVPCPAPALRGTPVLSNYPDSADTLRPFEVRITQL